MEARRRGASDTSAQKLGTDSPRRARAEKRGRSWRRSRGLGPRSQRAPSCGGVLGVSTALENRAEGRPWCPAQPRAPHLRGRLAAARRRGRPAGKAAAGGGGVSWCGRSASSTRPLGLSAALAVMALLFIRAAQEGRGTHARHPSPLPATVDVASRSPGAGPAVRAVTWPAGAGSRFPREPSRAGLPLPDA